MIEGISLGSDDYPVKPFLPLELVARVGAIFRRIEMARGGAGLSQSEVRAQASAFLALPKDGNYAANREVYVAVLGSETQVSFPRDTEYYADFDDIYELCAELISSDTSDNIKKDAVLNGGRYRIVIKQLNNNAHTRVRVILSDTAGYRTPRS